MATTRKYDNGKNGWTDYDDKGNAVAAGTYNAPGTARNPYNADPNSKGGGMNSGEGSLWNNATGKKALSDSSSSRSSSKSPSSNTLPQFDITSELEKLKQAQLSQTMAGLDKQRNSSLSNLSAEKATIEPEYQKQKIAAGVTAKQTARSFDEFMAQKGGAKSGIAGQGTLLNNVAYQGQKGALDQAEASALSSVARRATDVNNAYESDLVGSRAGIEAQALQNYIQQMNADRAYNQQNYQFDTTTGMQQNQFNQNMGLQRDQFGLQNQQYQSGLDQWQKQFDTGNSQWQKQFDTGNSQWQQNFDYTKTQQQWANEFAQKGFTADQAIQMAQLAIAQQNANTSAYSASRSGSSGGSSSANLSAIKYQNEQSSQQALASSMQGLQQMASEGKTRSEILKFINANAGDLQANGVPVQDLYNWATKNFTWDKNGSGWYNTTEDD